MRMKNIYLTKQQGQLIDRKSFVLKFFTQVELGTGSFYNTHTLFMGMVPTQLIPSNVI
jgi:hypothetical protein